MATTSKQAEPAEKKKPEPTCETCLFPRPAESNYQEAALACHRFPPSQDDTQQRPGPFPFPIVKPGDWCGEHKPKPKEADNGKEKD